MVETFVPKSNVSRIQSRVLCPNFVRTKTEFGKYRLSELRRHGGEEKITEFN